MGIIIPINGWRNWGLAKFFKLLKCTKREQGSKSKKQTKSQTSLSLHLLSPPFLVSSHPPSFLFFFCFLLLRLSMCIFLIIIVAFPSTHDICFHVPYLCTWPFFWTFLSALYSQESPFRPLQNAFPCQYCKAFPSISMQSKLLLSFLLRRYSAL